jgi:hypothetical protein
MKGLIWLGMIIMTIFGVMHFFKHQYDYIVVIYEDVHLSNGNVFHSPRIYSFNKNTGETKLSW